MIRSGEVWRSLLSCRQACPRRGPPGSRAPAGGSPEPGSPHVLSILIIDDDDPRLRHAPPPISQQALRIPETSSSTYPCGMRARKTAVGYEEDVRCDSTPKSMKRTAASTCMPGQQSCLGLQRRWSSSAPPESANHPRDLSQGHCSLSPGSRGGCGMPVDLDWLADLCVQEGLTCVLGHAQSMKAIHGGRPSMIVSTPRRLPCCSGIFLARNSYCRAV